MKGEVMKIIPLFDRVLIRPQKNKEKSQFGILLPSESEKKTGFGEVVAVGDGGVFEGKQTKMLLKVGDKVFYSVYAGTEVKMEQEDLYIIRQTDVYGVVEE